VLAIPRGQLQAMAQECFEVTSILVHTMVDRTRSFTSSDLQNEKMISLGKLSAGLAHELNNPASAIKRCAAMLCDQFAGIEDSVRSLAAADLTAPQLAALRAATAAAKIKQPERTPIEQADREEAFAAWLARHGAGAVDSAALAETAASLESLNQLAAAIDGASLTPALRWLAASSSIRNLADRIQDSAAQISNLVRAVKGFTHMDQANVAEPVDVGAALADTVGVLQAKASEKSATVTLELEAGLPKARGYAAELNQIWSNLIENALDAVARGGQVKVLASHQKEGSDRQKLIVRVVDDGPGIAADIRDRIFDPFFTTKPMGQGIGLGLDIARRLARHNEGSVDFESRPGQTEFRVTLRIAAPEPAPETRPEPAPAAS
jgi:signal transduction histidine kinase